MVVFDAHESFDEMLDRTVETQPQFVGGTTGVQDHGLLFNNSNESAEGRDEGII